MKIGDFNPTRVDRQEQLVDYCRAQSQVFQGRLKLASNLESIRNSNLRQTVGERLSFTFPICAAPYPSERRRHWSREEKERLVAASFEPDLSVSEVARSAGIHVSQLFRWRKELCDRIDAGSSQLFPIEIVPAVAPPAVEVPTPSASPVGRRRKSGIIEIELGDSRRVRVDRDVDAEALGRVLNALGSR